MKIRNLLILSVFLCFVAHSTQAQKIRIHSGNLKMLKGQKQIGLEYSYDNMRVGKFDSESDYIAEKTAKYNEDEPGRGDEWAGKWFADRASRFEPKFEDLLNKHAEKTGMDFYAEARDPKYSLIVNTSFTEPGFNIYITKKPAQVTLDIRVVETANPDKTLAEVSITRAPGRSMGMSDMDTGTRLQEAYAKAGKEFGKFLSKNL